MSTPGAGDCIWEVKERVARKDFYLCRPIGGGKTHWAVFISRFDLVNKYLENQGGN